MHKARQDLIWIYMVIKTSIQQPTRAPSRDPKHIVRSFLRRVLTPRREFAFLETNPSN